MFSFMDVFRGGPGMRSPRNGSASRWSSVGLMMAGVLAAACAGSPSAAADGELLVGTWGGDNVAMIVFDSNVHVHFGCTNGDFERPPQLDVDGRFNVAGSYRLRAFPIAVGPLVPAQFSGVVRGSLVTLSVAVDDTVEKKLVAFGPSIVTFGRDPSLNPCPICRMPSARLALH